MPGSQPSAIIRGQNSINANSGPYIVVDGIPLSKTGGSLNDINPNDIESIEVLKDAVPGIAVSNPAPATGGRDMEQLDNALLRGPHAVNSYERVVTARDYERVAVRLTAIVEKRTDGDPPAAVVLEWSGLR